MKLKFFISIISLLSAKSFSDIHWMENKNTPQQEVEAVNIIYSGDVNDKKVAELISVIDDINNYYTNAKSIRTYINSSKGSMESGYLAMQAIKHSVIPIETFNLEVVASAATLMYCGAKKRQMFSDALFILHPVRMSNIKSQCDVNLNDENIYCEREYFKMIYNNCTNYTDAEIKGLLSNHYNIRYLDVKKAQEIKLSKGVVNGVIPTYVSYFITNDEGE